MRFPQEFIERVRESTNIVQVISQYVQLRNTGGQHQGLCPFHNEKSPSFSVSEDKQVYHCFGCKAGGNVITFVQNYQGLTFPETIEYLAKRAGLTLPDTGEKDGSRDLKATLYKINGLAAQFYHAELKRLPASHEVHKYMQQRGLTEELTDAFKLGFAADWSTLADHFAAKRVPVNPAEQLGLIRARTAGKNGHFDLFHHRLIFPIFSPTGQCIGFGGRVLSKEQQPKYLNSPDSSIFHKGKVFYGLDHSAKYIRNDDEAIIVEGYMDWLALAKAGIHNIVATLGTALTADHARAVKRYTNKVLLLFDGDEAGKNAARRSLPILLNEGILARGLFLPDQLDPDEFLTERGGPALRQQIQSAPDLFQLISTEQWLLAKGSPTGKIQLLDEFAPILTQIPDKRLGRLYAQSFATMIGVEEKLVEQSMAKTPPKAAPKAQSVAEPVSHPTPDSAPLVPKIDLSKAPRAEVELLNVILIKEVYLKEALASGVAEHFRHSGCKATFKRIAEVYGLMPNKFDTLSALLADEITPVETITRHLSTNLNNEAAGKLLQDCIKRVKSDFLKVKSKELVSSLRGTSDVNPSEQLEQIMNIHKNRRSLNRDS